MFIFFLKMLLQQCHCVREQRDISFATVAIRVVKIIDVKLEDVYALKTMIDKDVIYQ